MASLFHVVFFCFFLFLLGVAAQREVLLSVLTTKDGSPADGLFVASLQGAGDDGIHMAMHYHDLSFAGFANRSHHWHVFRGDEGILPDASPLPFRNTYCDLIGGLGNLPELPLGRAPTLRTIQALAYYDADTAGEEETAAVRRAVAALSVVLTQSARLKPVMETVARAWEGEAEACVAPEQLPYIEHWDTMSFELVRRRRTGAWDGPFTELLRRSADVRIVEEEALAIAGVPANRSFTQLRVKTGWISPHVYVPYLYLILSVFVFVFDNIRIRPDPEKKI
uniref:rRNA N-glycosylase n=1 Tax=Oryza brachyantha TaxID=4533 RepID=J3LRP7_ORYBR